MRRYLAVSFCLIAFSLLTPIQTRAQEIPTNVGPSVQLVNPLKSGTDLPTFLTSILEFIIRIGVVVVTLMVIFVGYKFVVAQGNSTKIEEAKKMLLYTIIGALILLGSQVIATTIQATVKSITG